jgi:hypothetical protein
MNIDVKILHTSLENRIQQHIQGTTNYVQVVFALVFMGSPAYEDQSLQDNILTE